MSKIDLDPITSGYNLSKINANFQKVEDELNNKVLYRNPPAGEPNSMSSNLDMNSRAILNASKISSNVLELGGVQVVPTNLAVDPYNGTREALRRSYAEVGYNLVAGSFEAGGTLTSASDVLLHEASGKAFSGPAGTVAAGTNPATGGFVDVSAVTIYDSEKGSRFVDFTKMLQKLSDDNGLIYDSAVALADSLKVPLFMGNNFCQYNLTSSVNKLLPRYGIIGNFDSNISLSMSRNRDVMRQSGKMKASVITISGAQYTRYEFVDAPTIELDGNAADYGVFWNIFDRTRGLLNIDVTKQSTNHNLFMQHRGGVHIFGGNGTSYEECDNNVMLMCDSTGADITDKNGVAGWHLLNEGYKKQKFNVGALYMEGTGLRAIKGNISTFLGVYADGTGSPYATSESCHHMGNGDHNLRNTHDHLSANPQSNLAVGGLWDVINCSSNGKDAPLCFSATNVSAAISVDTTLPLGFVRKFGGSTTIDFSSLNVKLDRSYSGRYGIVILIQVVRGNISLQVENNGSPRSMASNVYHDMGNNWRLYRLSFESRGDKSADQLTVFNRLVDGVAETYLGGVWATPAKTTFMPSYVPPHQVIGVSPDGTIAATSQAVPVGGIIYNKKPTLAVGDVATWIRLGSTDIRPLNTIS